VRRRNLDPADAPASVRAVVEAQMMAMANHAAPAVTGAVTRVLATGGASANRDVLQVMADAFGAAVYQAATGNAACLGAALRAYHAHELARGRSLPWMEVVRGFTEPDENSRVDPVGAHARLYEQLRASYARFEQEALHERA
jgi:xylulokinase